VTSRITLAAIAGAHGVRGEVRLKLFADGAASIAAHKTVFIAGNQRQLASVKDNSKGAIARIIGVDDRTAAEALRGALIEVDRGALPPLEEGEFYHADLIGLPCVDAAGEALGEISAIENYGAGDIIEVRKPDGKTSLVPFEPGIADLGEGQVVIDPDFLA
jgi:16S rRNA processing protein RimM